MLAPAYIGRRSYALVMACPTLTVSTTFLTRHDGLAEVANAFLENTHKRHTPMEDPPHRRRRASVPPSVVLAAAGEDENPRLALTRLDQLIQEAKQVQTDGEDILNELDREIQLSESNMQREEEIINHHRSRFDQYRREMENEDNLVQQLDHKIQEINEFLLKIKEENEILAKEVAQLINKRNRYENGAERANRMVRYNRAVIVELEQTLASSLGKLPSVTAGTPTGGGEHATHLRKSL
ncbi:unnamed protein product [Cyprideis torosa]|uniref:Uncharacterized protein n=1 Tax=Cyprideis torosa TaxID=163714 RepID=A0A7R8W1U6_9CRUS|nr:unnamed protein product [Cyprideis torosa]CAG0881293.1 unnamed protein product [Cyprideis torosa]